MSDRLVSLTVDGFNRALQVVDHPVSVPLWVRVEPCPLPSQPYVIRYNTISGPTVHQELPHFITFWVCCLAMSGFNAATKLTSNGHLILCFNPTVLVQLFRRMLITIWFFQIRFRLNPACARFLCSLWLLPLLSHTAIRVPYRGELLKRV